MNLLYSVSRVDNMTKVVERFFTEFKDAFKTYLDLRNSTTVFHKPTMLLLSSYSQGDKEVLLFKSDASIKINPKSEQIIYVYNF